MSGSLNDPDVRAAYISGLIRKINGMDSVEKGLYVQVVDLAGDVSEKYSGRYARELERHIAQLKKFKKKKVSRSSDRWKAENDGHAAIIKNIRGWMESLRKVSDM